MDNPFAEIFKDAFNNSEKPCKFKLPLTNKKVCTKKGLKEVNNTTCANCKEREV